MGTKSFPHAVKLALFVFALFFIVVRALAQGTLNFATGTPNVNAPATVINFPNWPGPAAPSGPDFLAQLYIGPAGVGDATLLTTNGVGGAPVPFNMGYVFGGARAINGMPGGTTITVQVRAWYAGSGHTSWESAPAAWRTGTSGPFSPNLIQVTLGMNPALPPDLVGLQPFFFGPLSPEPSTWALLVLGGAVFAFRLRRRR